MKCVSTTPRTSSILGHGRREGRNDSFNHAASSARCERCERHVIVRADFDPSTIQLVGRAREIQTKLDADAAAEADLAKRRTDAVPS